MRMCTEGWGSGQMMGRWREEPRKQQNIRLRCSTELWRLGN